MLAVQHFLPSAAVQMREDSKEVQMGWDVGHARTDGLRRRDRAFLGVIYAQKENTQHGKPCRIYTGALFRVFRR